MAKKVMNIKEAAPSLISEVQLDAWKREHKTIFEISVKVTEGDVATGYIKKPSRDVVSRAISLAKRNQVIEAGDFIMQNSWLGGDERLLHDDDVSLTASGIATETANILDGELKKISI
jgi:hypothetical protein